MDLPTWYALSDLSGRMKKDFHELLELAVARRMQIRKEAGAVFLHRDEMPEFCALAGRDATVRRYDLGGSVLEGNERPWARALRAVYGHDAACPASISPSQGELLRSVLLNVAPAACLEIGCFMGASTLWMCSALAAGGRGGVLHSVDLYGDKLPFGNMPYLYLPDALSYIRERLAEAGLSERNVQHPGDSRVVGQDYERLVGAELDLLFIDGDHTVPGCMADFQLYEPHLKPGGYLILHDIFPDRCGWEGPGFLIENVIRQNPEKYQLLEINTTPRDYGMALVRKLQA